jgi:large subunit ribosomal protein L25
MSISLKAEKREQTGSAAAKKLKNAGMIPGVIYSKKGNSHISISSHDFENEYFKGTLPTTVVELDFNGKKTKVIAHKIELDPVSDRPIHVDFFDCSETKGVVAKPKLTFVNQDKSPGMKKGGFLHVVLRRAEVTCTSENVPSEIIIEAGELHIGSKVRANDVVLPQGVKFTKKGNFLIASVTGRGKSEEAPAAGATPAAGAAPAAAPAADAKKAEAKK